MDASFPRNDIRATPYHGAGARVAAVPHAGAASKTFLKGLTWNDTSWDDVDEECFLAAIPEMERARAGILGRWPFWEIREWAILYPKRAETALGVGVIAAGVTLGVLWHVLSPHLARHPARPNEAAAEAEDREKTSADAPPQPRKPLIRRIWERLFGPVEPGSGTRRRAG